MKKKRAAARAMTTTPPIAIPAIAPAESLWDEEEGVAVAGAALAEVEVEDAFNEVELLVADGASSGGKSSPGWSMKAESSAICL
jgi:hypothetical protein